MVWLSENLEGVDFAVTLSLDVQLEVLSEKLRHRETELAGKSEATACLHQDLEGMKAELQRNHTSWQRSEKMLTERLRQCEGARDGLLQQLAEASRKLNLRSTRLKEEEEETSAELASCRREVQRLMGVVKNEHLSHSEAEGEVERLKGELRRVEEEGREALVRLEEGERRWSGERERVEECEEEGRSLREEVGRLSEELRRSQRRLQEELERRVEREKVGEETLAHLQQELAKRAQQVRQHRLP